MDILCQDSGIRKTVAWMTYFAGITDAGVAPINALRYTDRLTHVLDPEISVCHIVDEATTTAARVSIGADG